MHTRRESTRHLRIERFGHEDVHQARFALVGCLQAKASNGAYVNFNVGAGNHNDEVVFPDGSYYKYANAYCHRVFWGNVRVACHDGTWSYSGQQSIKGDINCFSDSNASWSSDDNSITTGWQP